MRAVRGATAILTPCHFSSVVIEILTGTSAEYQDRVKRYLKAELKRAGVSYFAIVGWLILSGQAPKAERMPKNAPPVKSKSADSPKNSADNPAVTPVILIETPEQAKASQRKERNTRAHDERDLSAQIRAADAAENQIPIGWLAVILSGAGTWLILWTLCLTRRANTIAEQSTNQQLRAYVHPEIVWLSFKGQEPFIDIRARNTGQTPAKWFEIEVTVKIISTKSEERSAIPIAKRKTRWAVIGAGCERIAGVHPDNPDGISRMNFYIADKAGEFFALGRIRYCDIFDRIWETEFTAFAKPDCGTPKHRERMTFANSNVKAFIAVKT